MKNSKALGIFLCGLCFLCIANIVALAELSMYIDKLAKTDYFTQLISYIQPAEFLCIGLALFISCWLMFRKEKH